MLTFLLLPLAQAGGAFATHGMGVAGLPAYNLGDLHSDLGRWPAAYYSKQVWCWGLAVREGTLVVTTSLRVSNLSISWTHLATCHFLIKDPGSLLQGVSRNCPYTVPFPHCSPSSESMCLSLLYRFPQGKEPLLYVTVLLLSLQFHEALRFLWKDETTRMYRVDAVHLAIAMHLEKALPVGTGEGDRVGSDRGEGRGGFPSLSNVPCFPFDFLWTCPFSLTQRRLLIMYFPPHFNGRMPCR